MDTRETILETALGLFSVKGFADSSIRDIARAVGIKESSIYYHFKNKRAILDALTEKFAEKSNGFMELFHGASQGGVSFTDELLYMVGEGYAREYLLDEFVVKFVCMMNIERAGDAGFRELYRRWLLDLPLEFQSELFEFMLESGSMRGGDKRRLALAYYAPVFYLYNRFLLTRDSEAKDEFLRGMREHTAAFIETYGGHTKA